MRPIANIRSQQDRRRPCASAPEMWSLEKDADGCFPAPRQVRMAQRQCTICPFLAQCEQETDEVIAAAGRLMSPMIRAGRFFGHGGTEVQGRTYLNPSASRRVAAPTPKSAAS